MADRFRNRVTGMFGIQYPIFAFSNEPHVVAAVSRAGGLGVLGSGTCSSDELDRRLSWLDSEVPGRYGVDILFPVITDELDVAEIERQIPAPHRQFVADVVAELGIGALSDEGRRLYGEGHILTNRWAAELASVSLEHRICAFATALGPVPAELFIALRERDVKIIGMTGSPGQARRQVAAGADLIVAQGTEAGGHVGDISTMVLVPQVVDAVAPVPVLAAGGIGTGRQMAASLALGAEGVWAGSLWLLSEEHGLDPILRDRLLAASSRDTIRTGALTGKPVRMLRNKWYERWQSDTAPAPLPAPLQGILVRPALSAALEHRVGDAMGTPLGQIVGMMNSVRPVAELVESLATECLAALGSAAAQTGAQASEVSR
ncbi:MAG TPA: nitronate monooxygenase family protein [Streptosporangiaceae bacterium]